MVRLGEIRLLVDHRDALVAERTRAINRLRWHLHELDPQLNPPPRALITAKHQKAVAAALAPLSGTIARLARELLQRCVDLTAQVHDLDGELDKLVADQAPHLLAVYGCGTLTAAKILGETADVLRFRDKDAFARYNGTAPLPVWSGNRQRFRLSRVGNRQLNAALHRIAITQAHYHDQARAYLERRVEAGNSTTEAIRALRRQLSDVVFRALMKDAEHHALTLRQAA